MWAYNTVAEMQKEYHEAMREWERQISYERGIVRSVPKRNIVACSIAYDNDEWEEPG